jgi:hypothetical protein
MGLATGNAGGEFRNWESALTMREPSPMYFCTSSEPETRMKQQSV